MFQLVCGPHPHEMLCGVNPPGYQLIYQEQLYGGNHSTAIPGGMMPCWVAPTMFCSQEVSPGQGYQGQQQQWDLPVMVPVSSIQQPQQLQKHCQNQDGSAIMMPGGSLVQSVPMNQQQEFKLVPIVMAPVELQSQGMLQPECGQHLNEMSPCWVAPTTFCSQEGSPGQDYQGGYIHFSQ